VAAANGNRPKFCANDSLSECLERTQYAKSIIRAQFLNLPGTTPRHGLLTFAYFHFSIRNIDKSHGEMNDLDY